MSTTQNLTDHDDAASLSTTIVSTGNGQDSATAVGSDDGYESELEGEQRLRTESHPHRAGLVLYSWST
jgi:hypothetical protein